MSMENAILEHAAALRELSAAIKMMHSGRADALALPVDQGGTATSPARTVRGNTKAEDEADEIPGKKSRDAELGKAVAKVEADAKKETVDAAASGETSPASGADSGDAEAAPLNYEKDVRPLLLAAIKKGKRGEIEAFLAGEGVKKADELPAEKLPALFDLAQKLAA